MAQAYSAPEGFEVPDFEDSYVNGQFDIERHQANETRYLERLAAEARKNGNSPLLGKMLRWQRADGYALYMVWTIKPLSLIWLELGDAWSVEEPLIRGLRVSDVKRMVESDERMAELFGR